MPRCLVVTTSRLYHYPLDVRIELSVFRPGKVEVNLRRMLLDAFNRPNSNNSHDAFRPETIAGRRQGND